MADGSDPNAGHNIELTDEQRSQQFQELVALMEKHEADAKVSNEKKGKVRKTIKAMGFTLANVDAVLRLSNLPRQEQEGNAIEQRKIMEILKVPFGNQMKFDFEASAKSKPKELDKRDIADAIAKGFKVGRSGGSPEDNPHETTTERGQAWLEGFNEGAPIAKAAMERQNQLDSEQEFDDEDPVEDEED